MKFNLQSIIKELPPRRNYYSQEDLRMNFEKIYREVKFIANGGR
ncbi:MULTISPECIES: hypothetical protein [Arenibacter]|nr:MULTISPECIES: hypothetical protein [Arenibacter]